jgi:hypothetical protein
MSSRLMRNNSEAEIEGIRSELIAAELLLDSMKAGTLLPTLRHPYPRPRSLSPIRTASWTPRARPRTLTRSHRIRRTRPCGSEAAAVAHDAAGQYRGVHEGSPPLNGRGNKLTHGVQITWSFGSRCRNARSIGHSWAAPCASASTRSLHTASTRNAHVPESTEEFRGPFRVACLPLLRARALGVAALPGIRSARRLLLRGYEMRFAPFERAATKSLA